MEQKKTSKYATKWKKLKDVLLGKKFIIDNVDVGIFSKSLDQDGNKIKYTYQDEENTISISLINTSQILTRDQLFLACQGKIDNTGNIRIWPCEEILAYYCILNSKRFDDCNLCELGAGQTALASCFLKSTNPNVSRIFVSDGNENCANYLKQNISNLFGENPNIQAGKYIWGEDLEAQYQKSFDFILIADCLFFHNYHLELINALTMLLKEDGEVIIIAPKRGGTQDLFVERARNLGFHVEIFHTIHPLIDLKVAQLMNLGEYKEDEHFPYLLRLKFIP